MLPAPCFTVDMVSSVGFLLTVVLCAILVSCEHITFFMSALFLFFNFIQKQILLIGGFHFFLN